MTDAWGSPPSGGWHGYPPRQAATGPDPRGPVGYRPAWEQASAVDDSAYPAFDDPAAVPAQRSARDEDGSMPVGGRGQRRRGGDMPERPPERRRPAWVASSVLIGVPLLAALASGGQGLVFAAGAVIGVVGAALLCSRPSMWWVATGGPPVVLLMALLGLAVGGDSSGTGKFATNMAKGVAGAFPVMGAALGCAVLIGVARLVAARGAMKGNGRG